MAFELITVLIVLAAILVALRPGVLLNSVYAFAEIMNMQSIRESLDNEDPASYEYYQQLASVSDNNYYMIEVFDHDGNTVYSNREKFLYSGDGDSVYYRTAESMYTTGRSVRVFDLFDDSASFDEYEYQDSEASGYYRYRVELKNGDTLRLWLPYYQVERNAHTASFLLTAFALISAAVACAIILYSNLRFSRPVAAMAEITESMAKLDFSKKCVSYPQTDVQNLGQNINILSESLSETLDELQDKNEKLTEELEHSALVDESRKSFIANVSHELKTPIAIIQGYAEGLKLGINSDPEGRSAIIKGQLAAFSMMFTDNGIKLIDRIPDGLTVHSDERTILLVLQNFLSNAVSNIGGKKIVQLTVEDNLNTYRVSVYNSGDPIDEDELDKIWYSFYKSSKKRKNEDFHFGLGLPIVKAIQKRLGRECGVVNEHGGVRFWFDVDK